MTLWILVDESDKNRTFCRVFVGFRKKRENFLEAPEIPGLALVEDDGPVVIAVLEMDFFGQVFLHQVGESFNFFVVG